MQQFQGSNHHHILNKEFHIHPLQLAIMVHLDTLQYNLSNHPIDKMSLSK